MKTSGRTAIIFIFISFFSVLNSAKASERSTVSKTAGAPFDRTSAATVSSVGVTLNWTKAADDVSPSSALVYEVRQSAGAIDTVASAEANGVIIQPYTADIATLKVTGLAPATTYFFNVIVKDQAGNKAAYRMATVTTAAASLTPAITTQPADQSVVAGQTATFSVVVATGTPAPFYQWTKGGVNISGATSASYTTPVTAIGDNGSAFSVVVMNAEATASVTSTTATLSVTEATEAVSITSQPSNQTVMVGQSATFAVTATGLPAPKYQWRKGGVNISGATATAYTTPAAVASDNAASFDVVVSNSTATVISAAATQTVNSGAAITTQPVDVAVVQGQTATFSVVATGTPAPTYQWKKNGGTIAGATASSYTTPVTANGDNGATYTVVVTNAAGSVTSVPATLTVGAAVKPAIVTQPASQTVAVGRTATFSVQATGIPNPQYQWKRDGTTISGAISATYSIVAKMKDKGARFSVVVSNSAGSVTSANATLTVTATAIYLIQTDGGVSLTTTASATDTTLNVSHALIQQDTGNPVQMAGSRKADGSAASYAMTADTAAAITGVAIIGLRTGGVLVTEAGVPASPEIASGRIYAEIQGAVNTGIALSNFDEQDALVSFSFTDANGNDFGAGSFTLPASHQIAAFLNQAPFNGPAELQGSFTFRSSVPVGAIALRGLANERSEFLITTLPVAALGRGLQSATLPHFADGGGWTTQVALTNASDTTQNGTVQFFGPGAPGQVAPSLSLTVNGTTATTFSYSIPPHASARLATAGTKSGVQVGSVRITAADSVNGDVPSATAIFSFRNRGVTVGEAGVSALPTGTAFRMYTESAGSSAQVGSIQSGFAIANPSPAAVQVALELSNLDGSFAGVLPASINVPAGGQIAKFTNELFPGIPATFQGIAKITAASPIAVTGLRGRYNERGDFLITTTPPMNEATAAAGDLLFPHIVAGSGYNTQIIIYGQPGSGALYLVGQDGASQ